MRTLIAVAVLVVLRWVVVVVGDGVWRTRLRVRRGVLVVDDERPREPGLATDIRFLVNMPRRVFGVCSRGHVRYTARRVSEDILLLHKPRPDIPFGNVIDAVGEVFIRAIETVSINSRLVRELLLCDDARTLLMVVCMTH